MGAIKGCYERELARDPNLEGRAAILFTISGDGEVSAAKTVRNQLTPELGDCVVAVLKKLRLHPPEGGSLTVEYPFVFEPEHKRPRTGGDQAVATAPPSSRTPGAGPEYDGEALHAQLAAEGVGKRKYLSVTRGQAARILGSPGGTRLAVTTQHRWQTPVTLAETTVDGIKAYTIEGMVVEQGGGSVRKVLLPMGPGTIYKVIGEVKLLGHTIKSDTSAPLVFIVHNARKSKDTEPEWTTGGPLAPVAFAFDDALNAKPQAAKRIARPSEAYLWFVHLDGSGWARLENGKVVRFP